MNTAGSASRCPYCFIEEKNSPRKIRRADELTIAETIAVIDDFAKAGARTVNIVGAGEPLLDSHCAKVIEVIHQHGLRTMLFINGTRLANSAELVQFLLERNASVVLKYSSLSPAVQDAVVGRRGHTHHRDAALSRLIDFGFNAEDPTRMGLDTIAFVGNQDETPAIHRWCRENNVFPITADYIPIGRTGWGGGWRSCGLSGYSARSRRDGAGGVDTSI